MTGCVSYPAIRKLSAQDLEVGSTDEIIRDMPGGKRGGGDISGG